MLADIQISKAQLHPFHLVFSNSLSSVQTLEPALLQKSRTGECGKNKKRQETLAKRPIRNHQIGQEDLQKNGVLDPGCGLFSVCPLCPKSA